MADRRITDVGYENRNGQKVINPTGLAGTEHGQRVYVLRCGSCQLEYGSNGSDILFRKCPRCQDGAPGLSFWGVPEYLAILEEGVEAWNAWRKAHRNERADLRSANLRSMDLTGCYLVPADLSNADLTGANLTRIEAVGVNCTGAILQKVTAEKARFSLGNFDGAYLADSDFREAEFKGTPS